MEPVRAPGTGYRIEHVIELGRVRTESGRGRVHDMTETETCNVEVEVMWPDVTHYPLPMVSGLNGHSGLNWPTGHIQYLKHGQSGPLLADRPLLTLWYPAEGYP